MTPEENEPFWLVIARRKVGGGPDWQWCRIEAIDKTCRPNARRDMIVEGGVPGVLKSGPRKGQPNWRKVERQIAVVTQEEEAAEASAFEAETGKCSKCFGAGKVVSGFGVGGTTYRACSKCKETGAAPTSAQCQEGS